MWYDIFPNPPESVIPGVRYFYEGQEIPPPEFSGFCHNTLALALKDYAAKGIHNRKQLRAYLSQQRKVARKGNK